ncbi:Phosphotransferase enzyme family [Aspergillus sclerotialis]|uniref:Phosphotransferase enzyme family n=1 Tax=Aspergillus sclerotialis TaxID=2070753 RepID=A0A3A2ZF47_9EURO|nr:Phosphotransferase enzyme family [Aspergillus sclerotialis]
MHVPIISYLDFSGSTIAVPKVHRVLNIQTENIYFGCTCLLVMDFIKGRSVEECWEHLNEAERIDFIAQVASMITVLQCIPVPKQQPGQIGCTSCLARSFWFTDIGAGPFGSKEELEGWFNHKLAICKNFKQAPETVPPFHFDKLVLTLQDIVPRNLILGPDGRVWLIDWGDAGIYPDAFEAASLNVRRFSAPMFTGMLFQKIAKHEEAVQQLEWLMYALTTGRYL